MKSPLFAAAVLVLLPSACQGVRGVSAPVRRSLDLVEHEINLMDTKEPGITFADRDADFHEMVENDDPPEKDVEVVMYEYESSEEHYEKVPKHHKNEKSEGKKRIKKKVEKVKKRDPKKNSKKHKNKSGKKHHGYMWGKHNTRHDHLPTVSPSPTPSPTITAMPSVSSQPSGVPTVSPAPTVSFSPSSQPTVTQMPTSEVVVNVSPPDEKDASTSGTDPDTDTRAEEPGKIMNKFALLYTLKGGASPGQADYKALSMETGNYLHQHIGDFFSDMGEVYFVSSRVTSAYVPSPRLVDYDALTTFMDGENLIIPSAAQLDGIIETAFTDDNADYLAYLREKLAPENPFSDPVSTAFSKHSSALNAQKASQQEEPSETTNSSNNAKIIAPVTIGATALIVAAALLVRRRKRRTDRVEDDEEDISVKNLYPDTVIGRSETEESTVFMDTGSVGHNSYVSRVPGSQLDPLTEEEEEFVETGSRKSPSEVMKEMNLASALEEIDLMNDAASAKGRSSPSGNGGRGMGSV